MKEAENVKFYSNLHNIQTIQEHLAGARCYSAHKRSAIVTATYLPVLFFLTYRTAKKRLKSGMSRHRTGPARLLIADRNVLAFQK